MKNISILLALLFSFNFSYAPQENLFHEFLRELVLCSPQDIKALAQDKKNLTEVAKILQQDIPILCPKHMVPVLDIIKKDPDMRAIYKAILQQ